MPSESSREEDICLGPTHSDALSPPAAPGSQLESSRHAAASVPPAELLIQEAPQSSQASAVEKAPQVVLTGHRGGGAPLHTASRPRPRVTSAECLGLERNLRWDLRSRLSSTLVPARSPAPAVTHPCDHSPLQPQLPAGIGTGPCGWELPPPSLACHISQKRSPHLQPPHATHARSSLPSACHRSALVKQSPHGLPESLPSAVTWTSNSKGGGG